MTKAKRPSPATKESTSKKKLCSKKSDYSKNLDQTKKTQSKVGTSGNAAEEPPSRDNDSAMIDDLFRDLANKKTQKKKETAKNEAERQLQRVDQPDVRQRMSSAGTGRPDEPKVHRYTAEGLPIYKFFHLGMQQDDGGTSNCPFDCQCCF